MEMVELYPLYPFLLSGGSATLEAAAGSWFVVLYMKRKTMTPSGEITLHIAPLSLDFLYKSHTCLGAST